MSIAVQQVGLNATVLRVCGEVDLLTAPMLQAEVDKQLMLPRLIVVIDLSGTTFFGVSGVAVLLEIRDQEANSQASLGSGLRGSSTVPWMDVSFTISAQSANGACHA
jgi:anti-anti-sigma factor